MVPAFLPSHSCSVALSNVSRWRFGMRPRLAALHSMGLSGWPGKLPHFKSFASINNTNPVMRRNAQLGSCASPLR
jgi:hypothetical protein